MSLITVMVFNHASWDCIKRISLTAAHSYALWQGRSYYFLSEDFGQDAVHSVLNDIRVKRAGGLVPPLSGGRYFR